MRFEYGPYRHPESECLVTYFGSRRVYNPRGRAQRMLQQMVVEGTIVAAGQAAIESRRREIEQAYALEGQRATLYSDAGSPTYQLDSPLGVRVLDLTWLQEDGKAHYATGLPFRITLEAENTIDDGDTLVSYVETVTRVGTGGPRVLWPELDNGPAIPQIVASNPNVVIVQEGEAVGSLAYPAFSLPLFLPPNLDEAGMIQSRSTPRVDGLGLTDWPIRWQYTFTFNSAQPLPIPIPR